MRQKLVANYKVLYTLISACYDPLLKSVYKSVPDKKFNKFYKKYIYVYLQLRSNLKSQKISNYSNIPDVPKRFAFEQFLRRSLVFKISIFGSNGLFHPACLARVGSWFVFVP